MKITLVGDSIVDNMKDYLHWFYGLHGHSTEDMFYPGTAPCDWFTPVQSMAGDMAMVLFMGNMFTACTQGRGAVQQVYEEDINHLADILAMMGKPVLWAGPPGFVGTTESANWRLPIINAAAIRLGQHYDNSAQVLRQNYGGQTRLYTSWMPCQQNDRDQGWCWEPYGMVTIRQPDAVHLADSGKRRLAERIVNVT